MDGVADHVGGALFAFGASGHGVIKPTFSAVGLSNGFSNSVSLVWRQVQEKGEALL
jgi:hypothetical protein